MAKNSKQPGYRYETEAGIIHYVDPDFKRLTPNPTDPERVGSIEGGKGGSVHIKQLRSLVDNEKGRK